jgi:hypothetical protein
MVHALLRNVRHNYFRERIQKIAVLRVSALGTLADAGAVVTVPAISPVPLYAGTGGFGIAISSLESVRMAGFDGSP